jgi:hypothetical protein
MKQKVIKQPSELYSAIVEYFKAELAAGDSSDIKMSGYQNFVPKKAHSRQVLLEIGNAESGELQNEGRIAQTFDCTLYAVISKAQTDAALQAMNLASALARRIHLNTWNWATCAVKHPQSINLSESFLIKAGDQHAGFEAWEINWQQTLMLGEPEVAADVDFPNISSNAPVTGLFLISDPNSNDPNSAVEINLPEN